MCVCVWYKEEEEQTMVENSKRKTRYILCGQNISMRPSVSDKSKRRAKTKKTF